MNVNVIDPANGKPWSPSQSGLGGGGGSSGSGNLFVVKTPFAGASVGDNLVLTLTGTTESWYNLNTHAAVAGPVDPAKLESLVSIGLSQTPSPVVSGDPGAALAIPMDQTLSAQANAATALTDLGDKRITGLRVDAWTAAQLTIQVSPDSNAANAADLYVLNLDGSLAQAKVNSADMAAGKAIALDPAIMATARYVRFVSGPSGAPVAQAAARTLTARLMVR